MKWLHRTIGIIGIIMFIVGLFNLEETALGYSSKEMIMGMVTVAFAYVIFRFELIEEKLKVIIK